MTTTTRTPPFLAFIDLETTQEDPGHDHAGLLEIGVVVVKYEPGLPEVSRASLLIRPPGNVQDHERMWQAMVPAVQAMHRDNGLWDAATHDEDAWTSWEADATLAKWLSEITDGEAVPIAGAGITHLDRPWMVKWLPQTFAQTTYWCLDIGSIRRALQLAGRDDLVDLARDVHAKPHRALADAQLHVAEARHYLQLMGSIPAATRE